MRDIQTTYEESCRWTVGPSARDQQDPENWSDPEKEVENGLKIVGIRKMIVKAGSEGVLTSY